MTNTFALLPKQIDCVEHCVEFIIQHVPDGTAEENLGCVAVGAFGFGCKHLRMNSVKSEW
jgi:hypothetical protein